jgi:nicotinate (nicotinamide) nucleotide adenylyltransferase
VSPRRLGILPGAFNPPTRAHMALARAARAVVDEVLFVLPRKMPHKDYSGVSFDDRLILVGMAIRAESLFSLATSEGGLFIEIAREAREAYGPETRLTFLCGRDAAERIVGWDYGTEGALKTMLAEFDMLVAARHGSYTPPADYRDRIRTLEVNEDCNHIAATEVRQRILTAQPWQHLVPEIIAEPVGDLYGRLLR